MPSLPPRSQAWRLLDMAAGGALVFALALFWQTAHATPPAPRLPGWYAGPRSGCALAKYADYHLDPAAATPSAFGYYWIDASWRCDTQPPTAAPVATSTSAAR